MKKIVIISGALFLLIVAIISWIYIEPFIYLNRFVISANRTDFSQEETENYNSEDVIISNSDYKKFRVVGQDINSEQFADLKPFVDLKSKDRIIEFSLKKIVLSSAIEARIRDLKTDDIIEVYEKKIQTTFKLTKKGWIISKVEEIETRGRFYCPP